MSRFIKAIISILILGVGIYYFTRNWEKVSQLQYLSLWQIIYASSIIISTHAIAGLKLKRIFSSFNVKLSFKEWYGLPMVRKLGNLVFFKSGTVANAYYFNKKHLLPYAKFIVGFGAEKVISLFVVVFLGLIISVVLFISNNANFLFVLLFIGLMICMSFLLFSSFKVPQIGFAIIQNIYKLFDIWNEFKKNKPSICWLIILEVSDLLAFALRYYIAFNLLNRQVGFFSCIVIVVAIYFAEFINIVPGGLGIREISVGLTATYLDHSFDYGVIAAALDRFISTICFVILGFIFFHLLHLKMKQNEDNVIYQSL